MYNWLFHEKEHLADWFILKNTISNNFNTVHENPSISEQQFQPGAGRDDVLARGLGDIVGGSSGAAEEGEGQGQGEQEKWEFHFQKAKYF